MSPSTAPAPPPPSIKMSPAAPIIRTLDEVESTLLKPPLPFDFLVLEADAKSAFPFCAQVSPGCQFAEQIEQNSLEHVGQLTAVGPGAFWLATILLSNDVQI